LIRNLLLKEFKRHPKGKAVYPQLVEALDMVIPDEQVEANSNLTPDETAAKRKADMMIKAFLDDMPVYKECAFSAGKFAEERLEAILEKTK
jgi:beta-glucosidase